jgi:hypothetical protein
MGRVGLYLGDMEEEFFFTSRELKIRSMKCSKEKVMNRYRKSTRPVIMFMNTSSKLKMESHPLRYI